MKHVVKKTDKRMLGHVYFRYYVDFYSRTNNVDFVMARRWCTQQFGDSVEYDIWIENKMLRNEKWCWERTYTHKYFRCRLMFNDYENASWYILNFQ